MLLGAGACTKGEQAHKDAGAPAGPLVTSHRTFTNEEFQVLSAACERMLPRDEDPGALDANVPEYIDRMLQSPELHQMKEDFVAGTAALNRRSTRMFGKPFFEATAAQQDELIALFRDSKPGTGEARYYELLQVLTLEGFLGDPSYGGNKGKVGWALIGFERVDGTAADPRPGYDGTGTLHHLHGGH